MSHQFLTTADFDFILGQVASFAKTAGSAWVAQSHIGTLVADKTAMMTEIDRLTKELEQTRAGRRSACAVMQDMIVQHDKRVTELLEANNREVERRRVAERRVAVLEQKCLLQSMLMNAPAMEPDTPAPSAAITDGGDWIAGYPGGPLVVEKPLPDKPKFEFRDGDIVLVGTRDFSEGAWFSYSKFSPTDSCRRLVEFAAGITPFDPPDNRKRLVFVVEDRNCCGYRVTLDPSKHRVLLHKSFCELPDNVRVQMMRRFLGADGKPFPFRHLPEDL